MSRYLIDYSEVVGKKYGKWTIKEVVYEKRLKKVVCECECGTEVRMHITTLMDGISTQCMKCKGEESRYYAVGDKKGKYTVIGHKTIDKASYYTCQCECGNIIDVKGGNFHTESREECNQCAGKKRLVPPTNAIWRRLVQGAVKRGLSVTVSKEHVMELLEDQEYLCALSGLPLEVAASCKEHVKGGTTASVDRIDSDIGYDSGNVQWVHKDINFMKQDYSEEDFFFYCRAVTNHQETKMLPDYDKPCTTDYIPAHLMLPNNDFTLVG